MIDIINESAILITVTHQISITLLAAEPNPTIHYLPQWTFTNQTDADLIRSLNMATNDFRLIEYSPQYYYYYIMSHRRPKVRSQSLHFNESTIRINFQSAMKMSTLQIILNYLITSYLSSKRKPIQYSKLIEFGGGRVGCGGPPFFYFPSTFLFKLWTTPKSLAVVHFFCPAVRLIMARCLTIILYWFYLPVSSKSLSKSSIKCF